MKKAVNIRSYRIGFDLGGTKMLAVVIDRHGQVVAVRRRDSKGAKGEPAGVARIVETIEQALKKAGLARRQMRSIGIGVPGMLDLDRGYLLHAPNLGWHDVPLKKKLQKAFGGIPVTIANDVDAGTYGEYRFGAARKARCVVGVFPGTGIGGACIYEGRILRGRVGSCMEIGHMLVRPGGELCGCGRRGCLETVASRLAVAAQIAAAACRGQSPYILKKVGTDLQAIRSKFIAAAIRHGDKTVERIVRGAARNLGQALVSVVHLLAPDIIVLGGGLVEEMPTLYQAEVEKALRDGVTDAFQGSYRVVTAELGDYATACGAAALSAID